MGGQVSERQRGVGNFRSAAVNDSSLIFLGVEKMHVMFTKSHYAPGPFPLPVSQPHPPYRGVGLGHVRILVTSVIKTWAPLF